jgi:hypothetical protein
VGGARGLFPLAAAMVGYGCDGCWRRTSDPPTVGIVEIVYGSIFFYSYVVPIHSGHLTRQLNKKDLDLRTLSFRWFLCPVLYGSRLSGGCAIVITTGKKSSSRLTGGCAIVITYDRKKKVLVVCLEGARSLLRPEKKNLVVCLAGA